jgi:hypothetical protein
MVFLVFPLLFFLLGGCSGEVDPGPPEKDGPPPAVDQAPPTPDTQPAVEWGGQCNDGDKRCATLFVIQECKNGSWVDFVDCSKKKLGNDICKCSMTLMYKCSVGANLCD